MNIVIEVKGDTVVIGRLVSLPGVVHRALLKKIHELTQGLRNRVLEKLSGEVLNVRSGRLRRSIQSRVEDADSNITGTVFQTADVPYGRIHEYGGTIHIPEVVPVKAKALRFSVGGKDIFAMRAKAHDVHIPERSFLRSSLKEQREEIIAGLKAAVTEGTFRG